MPVPVEDLWNPQTCPIDLLPWLAWALSIDQWNVAWSDAQKRDAVAGAIEQQRVKGTRASVEAVLASFDDLLELVEWFEAAPRAAPHTFEVRLPLVDADGVAGGTRVSAEFAQAIVTEVTKTKPVRAHFQLVQQLTLEGLPAPVGALRAAGYRRVALDATATAAIPWGDLLQTEHGEPLEDDTGTFIDGSAA